jgi:hypothetical protein
VYTHLVEITKTLTELGGGVLAYTQLPGSWGWSNAGLITDGDQSLLVDTLFDRRLTSRDVGKDARRDPGGGADRHRDQHPRQR